MTTPQQSKLNAARFDYEYMGRDIPDLERIYGYPTLLIEREIEANGWERKIEPTQLPDSSDMATFAKALEETTRTKLSIIALFRQIENQPMIAQLEKIFLQKAITLANGLTEVDPRAAQKLQTLVNTIATLQDRDPVKLADSLKQATENSGVTVQIMNQIQ